MLCKISFRKKHVWVQHVLAWHASVAKQTAGATDRLAAPMATKHHPEAWNAVFNLLGDNVASVVQHPTLKTVQHVFYFGGSSKMRSCFFEPDSLGSFRVFCSGKVRLQFFQASSLAKAFTRDASVPFTKDCENFLTARLCGGGEGGNLPPSRRYLVDCSAGPIVVLVPPATLLVQESLDGKICSGIRRSFSPISKACVEEFSMACSDGFALKDLILSFT